MRIFDTHDAALDALDPIALVAELKNVAGQTLDCEILIHGPDELVRWFQQYSVVGIVGYGATAGERRKSRATPTAQHSINRVVMDERAAPAVPRAEAVCEHFHDSN